MLRVIFTLLISEGIVLYFPVVLPMLIASPVSHYLYMAFFLLFGNFQIVLFVVF